MRLNTHRNAAVDGDISSRRSSQRVGIFVVALHLTVAGTIPALGAAALCWLHLHTNRLLSLFTLLPPI